MTWALAAVGCWLALLPYGVISASPVSGVASAQSHYERPSIKKGPYQDRVLVFVHGIFGDADSTWRYSPTVYWPRLLLADETFKSSDVYVANYSSPYFGNTMNLDEVVTNLNNRFVSDEVFSKHREVVFVCHSLGGLVVQRLLETFRQYAAQVPFIYFFSTPETGAQVTNLASVFSSDPLLKALIPGDENAYLQNLENEWKAAHFQIHRFCAYEKKRYKGVLVVDRLSGTRNCDDPPLAINEDHISIVKPDSVNHDSYVALQNAFRQYPTALVKAPAHKAGTTTRKKPPSAEVASSCSQQTEDEPYPYRNVCEDILADWLTKMGTKTQEVVNDESQKLIANAESASDTKEENANWIRQQATWTFDECCLKEVQALHAGALARFPWLRNEQFEFAIANLDPIKRRMSPPHIAAADLDKSAKYLTQMGDQLMDEFRRNQQLQGWLAASFPEPTVDPNDLQINQKHIPPIHNDAPFALTIKITEQAIKSPLAVEIHCSDKVVYVEDQTFGPPPAIHKMVGRLVVGSTFTTAPTTPQIYMLSGEHSFYVVEVRVH